jgi:GTP cyclohydrolase I
MREGLQKTPERFHKAFLELTSGYSTSVEEVIGEGIFRSESNGPIFVNEIEFFSLCEHHLLPFMGTVSIGYLPNEKILGLSKLARIVDVFAKRLQVQERLTREIAEAIFSSVDAKAVMVTVQASHLCMSMRGVKKINSQTRTIYQCGFEKLESEEKETLKKGLTLGN